MDQDQLNNVLTNIYSCLHPYQISTVNFVINNRYCGLFLPCGAGKTLITLTVLARIQANTHTLIVGPKPVARATWPQEIEKWGLPHKTLSLVVNKKGKTLSKAKREELLEQLKTAPPTLCFVNAENIKKLVDFYGEDWPFGIVVLDEAQMFKSYKSQRFKALASVRPYIGRLIELSGTPTPNSLQDLWPLIYLLDGGARLGKNITAYRNRFFDPGIIVNDYPVNWKPKWGAEHEIYQLISDLVISIQADNIQLPPVTYVDNYVEMDSSERALYKELKKESVLTLQTKMADDGVVVSEVEIIATNSGVLSGKLRQMASGTLYIDEDNNYVKIHEHKLEAVTNIINQAGSPVIIAYFFKSDLAEILRYFKEIGQPVEVFDGSREMAEKWDRQEIPVMLLQPASASRGLNLQKGGYTLVWYTLPWSLEHYIQTNARVYRQGQTHPVFIHHLICRNTMDEKVLKGITLKDLSQKRLLDAVLAEF